MKEHTKVAAVQEQACAVLRSLSASNANNRIEIAAKGGIVAVLAAMKEHPEVANVQKKHAGCNVISSDTMTTRSTLWLKVEWPRFWQP